MVSLKQPNTRPFMNLWISALTTLLWLSLAALQAVSFDPQAAGRDVSLLAERKVITAPDYWREHLVVGGKCDGAQTGALLVELARVFKPVADSAEAVALLAERRVIGAPDYWLKNAVAGRSCEPGNIAVLLNHVAGRLPTPPPASAKAAPLEATPAANLQDRYDIVVAGAGTGGCGAAVQAARMGRSVLLLEETDWIGGQMNAAAVTSMDEGSRLLRERGLYREWCGLVAAHYQPLGINEKTAYWHHSVCVEPRVGRVLLHKLLGDARGAGVLDLALRSRVTQVLKQGLTVTGVEVQSVADQGMVTRKIACQVLIDATEWGDVIPLAGARFRVGNCPSDRIEPTRRVQDNTWTAVVKQYPQGVPKELRIAQAPPGYTDKVAAAFARSLADGEKIDSKAKPWTWATFIGYRGMPDSSRPGDSPPITRTHLNYNNDFNSTVAEIEEPARREATNRAMRLKTLHLLYFIQHALGKTDWAIANDEAFDSPHNRAAIDAWLAERPDLAPYRAILIHFSIIPYTRESRRIVGLHTLTAREIERQRGQPIQFAHTIALGDYPVDLHGSMSPPFLELDLDRESDIPDRALPKGAGPFAIPFESFIPEQIDGFLPAEKNFSQSRLVNGATRLQPHTLNMGQATGVIAALAVQNQVQPRAVDPGQVQRVLLDAGATLTIRPVQAAWGTTEWKAQQMETLKVGQ
jgi:hypothetical protein